MSNRTSNPVFMRNVLLLVSVVLLVLAFRIGPALDFYLTTPRAPLALFFVAGLAFPAALAASMLAYGILQTSGGPWYARPGGVVFLVVILSCAAVAFVFVDSSFLRGLFLTGAVSVYGRILQFSGMFLLWTVILNWQVCITRSYRHRYRHKDRDDDGSGGEVTHRWRHLTRKDSCR